MSEQGKLLAGITELLARHDTKLALDYQSIKRLEKDTDEVTKSVGALAKTVHSVAGTVQTQSHIVNAILGITVIAFLGVAVKAVFVDNRPTNIQVAEAVGRAMRERVVAEKEMEAALSRMGMVRVPGQKTGVSKKP